MASQGLAVGKGFARWMRLVRFLYPCVPRISSDKLQHLINDEECAKKLVLLVSLILSLLEFTVKRETHIQLSFIPTAFFHCKLFRNHKLIEIWKYNAVCHSSQPIILQLRALNTRFSCSIGTTFDRRQIFSVESKYP